ncbi:hypothetical protein KSC_064730 [Ktedonobacter sp. SOSP1-52]|uniref:hypothetical protein n=1 Tax=Ktedonobacter sp. SOSP1-52 TaxID=2778366 RepID=UPI00191583DA|nr:hypothetical protein [Ktedonobacter sp. SOSP1-52]GHO67581.1 hypothetical protein KSC_064730 [Ktedonobacter sp. SOSP1-52]
MDAHNKVRYLAEIARQYPTLFSLLHSAPTDFFCIIDEEELEFLERELASFVALAEEKEKRSSLKLADMFPPPLPSPDDQAIPPYGDNFIPAIPVAPESMTHIVERPHPTCPCHEDKELISQIEKAYLAGEVTPQEATNIIAGKTF